MTRDDLAAMLAALVRLRRTEQELSLRDLEALLPEVSAATLSRVENGHLPDLDTFLQLVEWLGIWEAELIFPDERKARLTPFDRLVLLLESDMGLDQEFVQAIITVVRLVYRQKGGAS